MDFTDRKTQIVAGIVSIIVMVLAYNMGQNNSQTILMQDNRDTISVSGEAERFVAPDTAKVSFTMTRKSKNLSEATDSVNERVGEMVKDLKREGVKESDLKTTNYNVYPQYNYTERQQVFDGYRVTQQIEITIRDLDNVETVLTKIGEYEVDNVSGLSFFIDNDEEIREELRKEAIDDAKAKARELSRDLGVELEVIVGFNESGNKYYEPQPYYRASFADAAFEESIEASVPVGENELRASVTITYQLGK